jgi:hypothetical protein
MAESAAPSPGRIFVSYRREETAYPAGWLYDRLADRFGAGQVFKDVDSIQLGDDFVEVITRAVGSCDVLLALIGDQWLTIGDTHGKRRIDDPDDFVRLEIEAALSRRVRVIPILVDGASMPGADELPESLATLVRRQALELSPSRFEFDTSRLFRVLDLTLAEVRTAQDDATAKVAQVDEAPDSTATEVQETPRLDVAQQSAASSVLPGGPAGSAGAGPAAYRGEPPEKQRQGLSTRSWILAGVGVGIVLIVLVIASVADSLRTPAPTGSAADRQSTATGGIEVPSGSVTSPDGIKLTELSAVSRRDPDPPQVGDTVTVRYSLTNVEDQTVELAFTFVGVRNPADENEDTEDMNEGMVLAAGETVNAEGRVPIKTDGTWELWPCYELSGGSQCPDKWQEFFVVAN